MEMSKQKQIDATDIKKLIDDHIKAIQNRNINDVMSIYAKGIVSFDIDPPLWYKGFEVKREAWMNVFEMYPLAIGYEVHDLNITLADDIAFSHSLNHVSGTLVNGQRSDFWLRWTACFQKIDSNWFITHEQVSVPVDLKNGRARLDLKP